MIIKKDPAAAIVRDCILQSSISSSNKSFDRHIKIAIALRG